MRFDKKSAVSSVRARENSNDKRQQAKGRKTEYFLGNGTKVKIPSEIKPPLITRLPYKFQGISIR